MDSEFRSRCIPGEQSYISRGCGKTVGPVFNNDAGKRGIRQGARSPNPFYSEAIRLKRDNVETTIMGSIQSVILAGGVGTRLWPLSRTYYPKQFLKINGNSFFQETFLRCLRISRPDDIYVVTNEVHQYLVRNQIEELGYTIPDACILREPVGRNTLPAITWAIKEIKNRYGDTTVAVFPSDHQLGETAVDEIREAEVIAGRYLVTFGIPPTHPNTGYGYIAPGSDLGLGFVVREFKEKPDEQMAKSYIDAGYLWNSGIFLFSTSLYCTELERFQPELAGKFADEDIVYETLPSLSIDYGLMEKSDRVAVVPLHAQWTDLGTFQAWYEYYPHKEGNNVGDAEYIDSHGNFVYAPGKKTALIGVKDLVLVDTGDALLACDMKSAGRVNEMVKRFRDKKDTIVDYHLQVHRPWGSYTELENSRFFRIKRVTVKPGERLSLQMHRHRSEHWIVVSGMADVTLGEKTVHLPQGESTFVPSGTVHRLGNSGRIPLEVIEVQIGEYLNEDDIVRFSDDYNRA